MFSQTIFLKSFRLRRKLVKGEQPLFTDEDIIRVEDIVKLMKEYNNEKDITVNRKNSTC